MLYKTLDKGENRLHATLHANMMCFHIQINTLWGAGGAKHKARVGVTHQA